jgi:hypothetical protein
MEKVKVYSRARFSVEMLKEAIELFWKAADCQDKISIVTVSLNGKTWTHDDLNEFFADYRKSKNEDFTLDIMNKGYRLRLYDQEGTGVLIQAPNRGEIQNVSAVFESKYESSIVKYNNITMKKN